MGSTGSSVKRKEDPRLVSGLGLYVGDVQLPRTLHGAVVRSQFAHALIRSIHKSEALKTPGVRAVFTWEDLGPLNGPLPPSVSPLPEYPVAHQRTHFALAPSRVRYVGEPIAFVVADDMYTARDAAELLEVEYEPLPQVVDVEKATLPGSALVHDDVLRNIAAHKVVRVGEIEQAFASADLIVKERFVLNRGAGHSIETRGVVAHFEQRTCQLTVWDSTQAPIPLRNGLATLFNLPESRVRVVAPDVGGGFGPKIMLFYPEEILVTFAAIKLGLPVKWVEDRREYSVAASQERTQVHQVQAAFSRDGRILGFRDTFLVDTGAYTPYGMMVPIITGVTLPGPYKIPAIELDMTSVYTNKTIVSPVRGAGRPTAVYVMERTMDIAAQRLGLDRAEIRRRNLIQPNEFPYDTGLIYQDGGPVRYDSGNYPLLLQTLKERLGYETWVSRQEAFRREGRYLGVGIALYVEGSGVGPYEMARVRVEPSGRISVATGVGTQGQGQRTTLAQITADLLGVGVEDVDVEVGDTAEMSWGIGTFASRSATVAGNAVYLAASEVRRKTAEIAAQKLECNPVDLEFGNGRVYVRGADDKSLSLGELASAAQPLRGLIEKEPGLEAIRYFSPRQSVFSSGAHGAVAEVDAETGAVMIHRYVIVHDCGRVINPMIVEGQILGGLSNGIGSALYEEILHDDNGQPINPTFMDYLIPSSLEMPSSVEVYHLETPSPFNPLGVKGVGEAGVIPVAAVIASAVEDALGGKVKIRESPLKPATLKAVMGSTS